MSDKPKTREDVYYYVEDDVGALRFMTRSLQPHHKVLETWYREDKALAMVAAAYEDGRDSGQLPFPLEPGMQCIWEPKIPNARKIVMITEVKNGVVWSKDESGMECWNDEDRFREACVLVSGPPDDARATLDAMLKAEREKALREAAEICTNIAKNYSVMKPDQVTYEPLRVQEAAKSMVRLAREDILALIKKDDA